MLPSAVVTDVEVGHVACSVVMLPSAVVTRSLVADSWPPVHGFTAAGRHGAVFHVQQLARTGRAGEVHRRAVRVLAHGQVGAGCRLLHQAHRAAVELGSDVGDVGGVLRDAAVDVGHGTGDVVVTSSWSCHRGW
jgi:hypothetical protein